MNKTIKLFKLFIKGKTSETIRQKLYSSLKLSKDQIFNGEEDSDLSFKLLNITTLFEELTNNENI